jgi:hypothetical protein
VASVVDDGQFGAGDGGRHLLRFRQAAQLVLRGRHDERRAADLARTFQVARPVQHRLAPEHLAAQARAHRAHAPDQHLVVALLRMQRRGDGRAAQAAEGNRRGRVADRPFPFLQRGRVAARGRGDEHQRTHAVRRLARDRARDVAPHRKAHEQEGRRRRPEDAARHRLDRRVVAQVGMDDGTEACERRHHVVP